MIVRFKDVIIQSFDHHVISLGPSRIAMALMRHLRRRTVRTAQDSLNYHCGHMCRCIMCKL